ncbi:MAG: efflux RND transporter periplasmic adaptor subunit [Acidobacteriota bacterium]|nr:efflux RND transporter periplasmic adaptor subunit [Acidobacteriota bacterium]
MSPPVSGVVRRVVPERFAAVKTGDTLVELDDRQGVENLRQERVNLEAARVQLVQAQDQLGHLQSVRERYEQLSAWGAVAAMTLEEATANVARQEHEVRLAGQRVAACEANILYLKEQAGRTRIKSPIDGIVTDVFVTKGQFVAPGGGSDQAATLLVVSDTSELFAQLLVDEIDVSRIRVGQEIELKFDALPDKRAVGRVRQIAPAPDNSQGKPGVSFETSVALETPVPEVRVGMTVFAVMRDARATPRRIPAGAVQSRGGEAWVWQEDGGRARKKAVRVRDCSGGECLLVGGLEAGAVVLAGPDARLRDMVEGTPLAAPRQGEAGHVEDHPR